MHKAWNSRVISHGCRPVENNRPKNMAYISPFLLTHIVKPTRLVLWTNISLEWVCSVKKIFFFFLKVWLHLTFFLLPKSYKNTKIKELIVLPRINCVAKTYCNRCATGLHVCQKTIKAHSKPHSCAGWHFPSLRQTQMQWFILMCHPSAINISKNINSTAENSPRNTLFTRVLGPFAPKNLQWFILRSNFWTIYFRNCLS